MSLIGGKI